MDRSNTKYVFIFIGAFILVLMGIGIGYLLNNSNSTTTPTTTDATEQHLKGQLTRPLVSCDTTTSIKAKEFDKFETQVSNNIDDLLINHKATHVSIYFRDMDNGAWFGINEKEKFSPASLLKVPNMIAILREAQTNPDILKKEIPYTSKLLAEEPHFPAEKQIEIGKSYTVDDLVNYMIVYSDNEAMRLLRNNYDTKFFNQIYNDLGMNIPDDNNPDDFMTVKTYSSFFRILYNASYLNEPLSEKALNLLSQVKFNQGIVGGVPAGIVVAHKFGERVIEGSNIKQLHDCGIIYYPDEPYLLCIMTRGNDYDQLANIIQDLSKKVWNEVQKRQTTPSETPHLN
jgi:beta-lactamase class A